MMKQLRVPVPKGRDPFVNARLVSLGVDARGRERFWISSCNGVAGSAGVVIGEDGQYRIHRLAKPHVMYCYSAAPQDANTLWLCVNLSHVARVNLQSGAYTLYPTGAGDAFVCCGGRLDPATGKFFALGYLDRGGTDGTTAISFDTKTRKAVVHRDVAPDQFMYSCHPNPDGTYTGLVVCPGNSLVHWDPRAETVEHIRVSEQQAGGYGHSLCVTDERGRVYFPSRGWYDLTTRGFAADGPRPEREVTWFERHGDQVFGTENDPDGQCVVYVWDMPSGKVRRLVAIPSCYTQGITVARSGKLISVNIYGEFRRYNVATGRLEMFRQIAADTVQPVDHILRLSRERLIGSSFITQRFWEINLKTGAGYDCGRAAPGGGQVQHFWKIGARVYLTSYTTANLLEYDPAIHPHFPENPRVVAEPPESMRPVAFADDGRRIYYSSNRHYGRLGCTVTAYDTRTGQSIFSVNPVEGQAIHSIWLDRPRRVLLGHTTFRADCDSCPPASDITFHVRLFAEDLSLADATPLPRMLHANGIHGPLDARRLLCQYYSTGEGPPAGMYLAEIDRERFAPPDAAGLRPMPPGTKSIHYAGRPGRFVLHRDQRVELWNMRAWECLKVLRTDARVTRVKVQGPSLYLIRPRDMVILDDVLR